ncbi:GNAT family N-acetyltransferase [Longispora albida]|uniref:GNAT family N-acetyltransferase n=1 Tax=Longispora albida TaxID=203523 RepID=UPI00037DF12E|nr:GNAT family N-acetyltransferase [Longispora albida]
MTEYRIGMITERLLLRRWQPSDHEPYAAMNADPAVMEHFVSTMTREQSDAQIAAFEEHFETEGFGLWAVEVRATGEFAGFTGLKWQRFEAEFTPAVEIGWRLARSAWGHGYATEAARAALAAGWEAGLDEIVSMTATSNLRSMAVMERIGMTRDPAGDFDFPTIPAGHPLRRHVLYRMARPEGA